MGFKKKKLNFFFFFFKIGSHNVKNKNIRKKLKTQFDAELNAESVG
jgi:hypothetical protein